MTLQTIDCRIYFDNSIIEETPLIKSELKCVLDNIKGNILSMLCGVITDKMLGEFKNNFNDPESYISIEEIFRVCNNIREEKNYKADNLYVVFLTNKPNNQKLISAATDKNIFINVSEIEKFSSIKTTLAISYIIIEKIFQLQLKNINNDLPIFHELPIGCINDYCKSKKELDLKLHRCKICESCVSTAKKHGFDLDTLEQIQETIKFLEKEINSGSIVHTQCNYDLNVSSTGEISIKGCYLKLQPLPKAYFLYILQQQNNKFELKIDEIKQAEEIAMLYQKLKKKGDASKFNTPPMKIITDIQNSFKLYKPGHSKFINIKSDIKKVFEELVFKKYITEQELNEYIIHTNEKGAAFIKLDSDKYYIHSTFKL